MGTKEKKTAALAAVSLLTAASVTAGSLFPTPGALLSDDSPSTCMAVFPAGTDDDGGGTEEDDGFELKRRGIRQALRARILRLPLAARLTVILPLWALGSVILAVAGAIWPLLSPMLGRFAGCALSLALLAGAFLAAAKTVFPGLPVKRIFNRCSLTALLLSAAALSLADAVFTAVWEDYGQAKNIVLSAGFFTALSCVTAAFVLRARKRRPDAPAPKQAPQPECLIFTDGAATYTVRVPKGQNR